MTSQALVKRQERGLIAAQDEALLCRLVGDWLAHERSSNDASEDTLRTYRKGLEVFCGWLADLGLSLPAVASRDVSAFKEALRGGYGRKPNGDGKIKPYSVQTVNLRLTGVRRFFAFLAETGRVELNPAAQVRGVKRRRAQMHKRPALSDGEVRAVLAAPDTSSSGGLRDKAILTLFSLGARSVEVWRANIGDVRERDGRMVVVVTGKGRSEADELVVVNAEAEPALRAWFVERLKLKWAGVEPDAPLFISFSNKAYGARLARSSLRNMVKRYFREAGVVGDDKSTHSLRHSAITSALRHGASLRAVQRMARHASIDTTLIYAHELERMSEPAEDFISYNGNGE